MPNIIAPCRRDFLKWTAASFALLAGEFCIGGFPRKALAASGDPYLLLCDTDAHLSFAHRQGYVKTVPGSVVGMNVASGETFKIGVPFFGHAITQDPGKTHRIHTFEQWGRSGALMDLKERALINTVSAESGNIFLGHSAFINDSTLVTTEDTYDGDEGHLVLRDSTSLKALQKMSAYGNKPHQCRALDGGKTLLVAHDNSLAWVEMASGKLLHQVILDTRRHTFYTHLDISADGWISAAGEHVVAGHKKSGGGRVMVVSPGGKVFELSIPPGVARDTGQILSIAFLDGSGLVAGTQPDGDAVYVWKYSTQEFVTAVHMPMPCGVIPDNQPSENGQAMLLTSREDRSFWRATIDSNGQLASAPLPSKFGGKGSHLTRIYV